MSFQSINAQINNPNLDLYLKSTEYIDSDHEEIINKALELTKECKTESEKVRAIFEFVRDSHNSNQFDSYKASDVLKLGGNSCHQRANLLAALCRASNIPSRRHLQLITIKDYSDKSGNISDLVFTHGITGIYLNGNWYLYEPVGNNKKWNVWIQNPHSVEDNTVKYFSGRDCLFNETDKIKIITLPVYFSDHTPFLVDFREKLINGEIGFFQMNK